MVAVLVFVTSGTLADEPVSGTPEDQRTNGPTSGMTVASLGATIIGPENSKSDRSLDRPDPIRGGPGGMLGAENAIVGVASFYDDPGETASGEQYDPSAFTAAAQLEIRHKFGGIRFGKNYRQAYAVAEYEGKKTILKFNDVGTLRPGRKFDLSRAAMAYFGGLEKGLLPGFRVIPLPLGHTYPAGPLTDEQLAALQIGNGDAEFVIQQNHAATPRPPGLLRARAERPRNRHTVKNTEKFRRRMLAPRLQARIVSAPIKVREKARIRVGGGLLQIRPASALRHQPT